MAVLATAIPITEIQLAYHSAISSCGSVDCLPFFLTKKALWTDFPNRLIGS
jgi:hypothetical protein